MRNVVFEYKEEEERNYSQSNGNGTPAKHVHFANIDPESSSTSRSSNEIDPPLSAQLGMNSLAQQSRGDISLEQGGDGDGTDSQGRDAVGGRSIEDMAGIILVSLFTGQCPLLLL